VVHLVARALQGVFSSDPAVLGSYRRGHLAVGIRADQISCCVDVLGRGAKLFIDLDESVLINFHAWKLQSKTPRVRSAPCCDQQLRGFELTLSAIHRSRHYDLLCVPLNLADAGMRVQRDALLAEYRHHRLRNLGFIGRTAHAHRAPKS